MSIESEKNVPPSVAAPPASDAQKPPEHNAQHYWQIFRQLGPAGPLALIAATVPAILGFVITGSLITGSLMRHTPWMRTHQPSVLLIYILGFTILGGLALLPTWSHSVLGGWIFGARLGCPAAIASVLGGAIVGYIVGRRASGDRILQLLDKHPRSRAVYDALLQCGAARSLLIVTLIRLPPSSPYAVTNLALAFARVNPIIYFVGTLIGLAPRTCVVVYISSRLSKLDLATPHHTWMIVATVGFTMLALGVISHFANQAIARVTRNEPTCPLSEPHP